MPVHRTLPATESELHAACGRSRPAPDRHGKQRRELLEQHLSPRLLLLFLLLFLRRQVLSQKEPKRRVVDVSIIDHMKRHQQRRQSVADKLSPRQTTLRFGILQDSRPRPRWRLLLSPWGGVRVLSLHLSWLLPSPVPFAQSSVHGGGRLGTGGPCDARHSRRRQRRVQPSSD